MYLKQYEQLNLEECSDAARRSRFRSARFMQAAEHDVKTNADTLLTGKTN